MAFNELELKRIDRTVGDLCRRNTLPQHADELRFICELDGHAVSIYEQRPPWRGSGPWTSHGIARFRFSRAGGRWTLFWMRQDLKWHCYVPQPPSVDLASLVAVVEADEYGAFFG
jgi:hypothetical protein